MVSVLVLLLCRLVLVSYSLADRPGVTHLHNRASRSTYGTGPQQKSSGPSQTSPLQNSSGSGCAAGCPGPLGELTAGCPGPLGERTAGCPGPLGELTAAGDYVLGGLFQLHDAQGVTPDPHNGPHALPCHRYRFSAASYQQMQVLRFAVEQINQASSLLPGVTLGYTLLDYCHHTLSYTAALKLLTHTHRAREGGRERGGRGHRGGSVVSVTGPFGSSQTISVAPLFMAPLIPMVTHGASSVQLSKRQQYPSFFRTIPSDDNQVRAMVALLARFGWNWVAFLGGDNDYSRDALTVFQEEARAANICLAYQDTVTRATSDFTWIFETLDELEVKVVVLFANVEFSLPFIQAAARWAQEGREGGASRVWIASETWSLNKQLLTWPGLSSIGTVLGVTVHGHTRLEGLDEFFKRTSAGWQEEEGSGPEQPCGEVCNEACPSCLTVKMETLLQQDSSYNFAIYAAVHAVAHALHAVLHCGKHGCRNVTVRPDMVTAALRNVSFQLDNQNISFDQNGGPPAYYDIVSWDWSNKSIVTIGSYSSLPTPRFHVNASLILWFTGSEESPRLRCSPECSPGYRRSQDGFHSCCFTCLPCPAGTYINYTADPSSCRPCPACDWSANGSTSCSHRSLLFLRPSHPLGLLLLLLASIFLLVSIATLALFLWQRTSPVVRSAGGPMSFFMLACLSLSAISVYLHIGPPSLAICKLRYPGFIITYGAVLACLAVRCFQLVVIFKMATKLPGVHAAWGRYGGPWVSVATITVLLFFLNVVWVLSGGPQPIRRVLFSSEVLDCSFGQLPVFALPVLLVALLSIACFLWSYLGRDLPAGYNEARSISLSLLLFFLSWSLALTLHLAASPQDILWVNPLAMLASLYSILLGYFLPKSYIIILRPERNTAAYFQTAIQSYTMEQR